uniref:hypothetical protein n=1 Tax=Klebsiella pneumoniae TaxID=573 RepID=UPI00226B0726
MWDTCHRFMGAGVYRSKGFSGYREGMTRIIVEPGSREHQSRIHKLLESRGPDSH